MLLRQWLLARRPSAAALDKATQSRPTSLFNKSNRTVATLPERTEPALCPFYRHLARETYWCLDMDMVMEPRNAYKHLSGFFYIVLYI